MRCYPHSTESLRKLLGAEFEVEPGWNLQGGGAVSLGLQRLDERPSYFFPKTVSRMTQHLSSPNISHTCRKEPPGSDINGCLISATRIEEEVESRRCPPFSRPHPHFICSYCKVRQVLVMFPETQHALAIYSN